MATVQEILHDLWSLAPEQMREDWDNVGLMVGRMDQKVERVLIALDPFYAVCQEAVQMQADLVLTHHPLFFGGTKAVTDQTEPGRCALLLAENRMAAISMHTNLDSAPGGVNDVLAAQLALQQIQVLAPAGVTAEGREYGLGRWGEVPECSLPDFLQQVKQALGCAGLRYCDAGRPVHRVAVGGGACASFLKQAAALGCDTFVTADVKYNQFQDAFDLGVNLIDAGHFWTENGVCRMLQQRLQQNFPELTVQLSQIHTDITRFA